jgi:hypothetical protein
LEQQFEIAPQVIEAFAGDGRPVLRFGENERALDDGLRVEREAPCAPIRAEAACPLMPFSQALRMAGWVP